MWLTHEYRQSKKDLRTLENYMKILEALEGPPDITKALKRTLKEIEDAEARVRGPKKILADRDIDHEMLR